MNDFLNSDLSFDLDRATWVVIAGCMIAIGLLGILKTILDFTFRENHDKSI